MMALYRWIAACLPIDVICDRARDDNEHVMDVVDNFVPNSLDSRRVLSVLKRVERTFRDEGNRLPHAVSLRAAMKRYGGAKRTALRKTPQEGE